MKSFLITDQKQFMQKLLKSDLFDHFLLSEASICAAISYEIDGHIHREFYGADEPEAEELSDLEYLPFGRFRPTCFELIKGKHTPLSMKFVLMLSPDNLRNTLDKSQSGFTPQDIGAAFMNITFKDGRMTLTSACSYKTFSMDHSFDQYWAGLVAKFLSQHEIPYDMK